MEFVRHRVFSFAQESTRYCNYSKEKFGNELTFIIPSWSSIKPGGDSEIIKQMDPNEHTADFDFICNMMDSEVCYMKMIEEDGLTPQQARQVLPNALKTEINMCGFQSDWRYFFELRDNSHAHPDMQALAKPLHQEFKDRNYV